MLWIYSDLHEEHDELEVYGSMLATSEDFEFESISNDIWLSKKAKQLCYLEAAIDTQDSSGHNIT